MLQRLLLLSVFAGVMLIITRQTYLGAILLAAGVIGAWCLGLRAIVRHQRSRPPVPMPDPGTRSGKSEDDWDGSSLGGMSYGEAVAWEREQKFGHPDDD